jgi:hypothetical protein
VADAGQGGSGLGVGLDEFGVEDPGHSFEGGEVEGEVGRCGINAPNSPSPLTPTPRNTRPGGIKFPISKFPISKRFPMHWVEDNIECGSEEVGRVRRI